MAFLLPNTEKLQLAENAKLSVKVFSAIHVYGYEFYNTFYLSSTNNGVLIINSSRCPDFSSTFAAQGNLVVVIVMRFLQHVYKTNVLLHSHPC